MILDFEFFFDITLKALKTKENRYIEHYDLNQTTQRQAS